MIGVLVVVSLAIILFCFLLIAIAEITVHPPRLRRTCDTDCMVLHVAEAAGASAQLVQISSADGILLSAWWIQLPPAAAPRDVVMLCHGVADSAFGVMGNALMCLRNGFSVLAPESRGHGRSAGFVTYGVLEAPDIASWRAWLDSQQIGRCFGFGVSLGASSLILSLQHQAVFHAVAAECPFSSFRRVAFDRVMRVACFCLPRFIARPLTNLLVAGALLYIKFRYQIDLANASPVDDARKIRIPVLLIHGTADHETPAHHSQEILAANPDNMELWLVPGAQHVAGYAVAPGEFERRVMRHFENASNPSGANGLMGNIVID